MKKSWPLFKFMMSSMFKKVPLTEAEELELDFAQPATFTVQTDGEFEQLKDISNIKVKKGVKITVI